MSLTKIGSIGINTGIAFAGVTTITTLNGSDAVLSVGGTVNFVSDVSIGGTVSIAGTLTYEDVTNVDAVGLITARDGIVVGSGITLSKDGDIFATGVTTSTTFSGSGANLTNLPAANVTGTLPAISGANLTNLTAGNLTGALPAISGANLTGIAATDNVRTGILDVAGVSTFRNTMNVGTAVTISESGIEATGVGITVANINGAQIGGRRNIIINGAMQVAQRGTSSSSDGYQTVDRFKFSYGGENEAPVQYQGTLASHESPYAEGHRYAYYVQNGNQTGGAGAGDYAEFQYKVEAQDIASCGWNYTSASSFITLSFWLKSNVGQNFYGFVYSADGTAQRYIFETGTVSANSWNKIVVKIPGGTNVQFDNDVNEGLIIKWIPFYGTDKTNNSATVGSWANYNGAARCPDNTSTWWTTDNSTFYLTGVQLEVGSQATPFEHRSYGEELQLCKRYFNMISQTHRSEDGDDAFIAHGFYWQNNRFMAPLRFDVPLRTESFSLYKVTGSDYFRIYNNGQGNHQIDDIGGLNSQASVSSAHLNITDATSSGAAGMFFCNNSSARLGFDAEL